MLGSSEGILAVRETPFLRRVGLSVAESDETRAGRIDWILVDPSTMESPQLRWCALETQSLYFSGLNMTADFEQYKTSYSLVYPSGSRRPDYRSGGPKRLSPQLAIKVPLLARWGIKSAVLVDRYFFNQMSDLNEISYGGEDDRLAEAELVWFVCDYSESGRLIPDGIHYSSLADSINALNAAQPIARNEFIANLERVISSPRHVDIKVFRL